MSELLLAAPDPSPLAAAALAGAAVWCFVLGWRARTASASLDRRLGAFVIPAASRVRPADDRPSFYARTVAPLIAAIGQVMHSLLPDRQIERIRTNLTVAGLPTRRHLASFLAAKALLAGILGSLAGLQALNGGSPLHQALLLGGMGAATGFYLPGLWLGRRMAQRRLQMAKALPDALDLLAISVGAGLGFDGAVLELVQRWKNPLTDEFGTLLRDLRLGKGRREAFRGLAERTDSPDVAQFVAAILQADQLGTPVKEALLVQADQIRLRRRHRAEEAARKATIKMLIPMVLFIFPAMFVVLVGPALPSIAAFFK